MSDENDQKQGATTPVRRWWSKLDWFESHPSKRWRDHLWMALAACVVFIPLLGSFGLWDPWETHYGEVARQIVERQDWISLWWGSHWEGADGTEGSYFFSKPVLLMWMMALGIEGFGVNPWAIRLGVALMAVVGVVAVFSFGCSVFSRRAGVLMAVVLGTMPFWAMLGRQAQTDMPFVGAMTVGMCFFMMAVFGKDRDAKAGRLSQLLCLSWIGVLAVPQVGLVMMGLSNWRGPDLAWMDQVVADPMVVVGVWSTVLVVAALALVVGLVWRRERRYLLVYAASALVWVPLVGLLVAQMVGTGDVPGSLYGWFVWGPVQASMFASCLSVALFLMFDRPQMTRRRLYLLTFYVFIALATLAKGLLGFMLPGAILFLYILITREWRMLKRVELLKGTLIFIAIAVPWYAAMLVRHHPGFWNRFFVHDHFQRFASGVHALSAGSFEHFVRWLGYGAFPWVALLPAALGRVFSRPNRDFDDDGDKAVLMLVLWMVVGFTLFSLSSTTFHHYVFPVVPAVAMLVGLALDDLLEGSSRWATGLVALGAGVAAVIAWDLIADPQQLKNIFTYRYDRSWDHESWDSGFQIAIAAVVVPIVAGMVLLAVARVRRIRRWAVGLICGGALGMTLFSLNVYMPGISSTMSQQELWDRYYEICEPKNPPPEAVSRTEHFCEEPPIAYKLNWRGETYHTSNQVRPVRSDDDWEVFVDEIGDGTFYGIMQHHRFDGEFQRQLPDRFQDRACLVHDDNLKFVLAKVPCDEDDPHRVDDDENGGDEG